MPKKTHAFKRIGVMKRFIMKLFKLFFCLLIIVLSCESVFSAPISMELAEQIARNYLKHINSSHTVGATDRQHLNGKNVAYLVHLVPRGYILVAGDDIRVPVKGYSLNSSFSVLPEAYRQTLLQELKVSSALPSNARLRSSLLDDANRSYWNYLINQVSQKAIKRKSLATYSPDTFLLTTQWGQCQPYNKFNPKNNGESTVTGCVQTAIAQIMRYHAHPASGSGVFTHTWKGSTLTAVMNRPFNWGMMPDTTNQMVNEYQQDEVAALMRDLGVLNEAEFGSDSTVAFFHSRVFERAFGYGPIETKNIADPDFFSTLINEIDNFRPVLLNLPGHMTVADGYASDGAGRKIHVNLGWDGAYDDYYYLDQTNVIGSYSFEPTHSIYYNIRPCEGNECDPYAPIGGGQPPVLASLLVDKIVDSTVTLRVEAYDPDGDTVSLSASSSCSDLRAQFNGNLLSLTPQSVDVYCRIDVRVQSVDGTVIKSFNVLSLGDAVYLGTDYDINGQFADRFELDTYQTYLGGDIRVSGSRGYSNQAFYIWIKDQNGTIVLGPGDTPVSGNLPPGFYTIHASLTSDSSFYTFDADYNAYTLNVVANDLNYTVADLAAYLNIGLTVPQKKSMSWIDLLLLNDR